MSDLWLPGAVRRPQPGGGIMAGGPPRATWHITWDSLIGGKTLPRFSSVANYLIGVGYCPHLMWDPWTGRVEQYYPATQGARALRDTSGGVRTNRMGKVNIQVETWFSPGCVVGGKRFDTVAETPCVGLDRIVAWMRSWGIPDVWPNGWPQWSPNSRSIRNWTTRAGHYGHCHVPENTHSDPGPMPRGMFAAATPSVPEEDDMTPEQAAKLDYISRQVKSVAELTILLDSRRKLQIEALGLAVRADVNAEGEELQTEIEAKIDELKAEPPQS